MPPDGPTGSSRAPTTLDPAVLQVLRLLDGERVLRTWRIPLGVLVLTNLRCVEILHRVQLFSPGEWEMGPSLLFYNLEPPTVVLNRYVRLSERYDRHPLVVHLFVHDPHRVAREIDDARRAGEDEWVRRRAEAERSFRLARQRWESADRLILDTGQGEIVEVRCAYCGNGMDVRARRCPSCGAPRG